MDKFKRHLITAALPYANGPLHIGHIAGVYVPADIYARYLRLKKQDVKFVCGTDEHGVPITIKASEEGKTPKDVVDKYHGLIKNSFEKLGISFDIFSRTTNQTHYETASGFFKTLYDKGIFIEKTSEQFYDQEADQFLADRYITGTCPHCHDPNAYGDQCENCGTSLNPEDLIDPVSAVTGNKPILKETRHWYLPLDQYEDFLRQWILEEHKEWKPNVSGQCKSWLDQGLQPRAVSRDLKWGVPLPIKEGKDKVLYVWFDAPIGYISATKELAERDGFNWETYWKDEETKLVHFIGKDNIVFHCIIFPVMLKTEGSFILPENVPANEFLNLEGGKISTSRNWAVWLHEYLEDFKGKEDVLRYVLCANMPETKDNDFTWSDFQKRNNNELVAILGNFVNRALVLTHKYFDGNVPPQNALTAFDNEIIAEIKQSVELLEHEISHYRFREALKAAMNVARIGNRYLADTEPWKLIKTDESRVQTILNIALQITANAAIVLEPFLPFSTKKIKHFLNINSINWELAGNMDILDTGHDLNKPELLFEKIEDEAIAKQREKLEQSSVQPKNVAPQKETVEFDDFTKLDIRAATIIEAEKVPKTKKLVKLKVDTGIDQRTVVAGIAEYYDTETLKGRRVSVLVNLAPRKLKGITSQGMILMAENEDGTLCFIAPGEDAENGAVVR